MRSFSVSEIGDFPDMNKLLHIHEHVFMRQTWRLDSWTPHAINCWNGALEATGGAQQDLTIGTGQQTASDNIDRAGVIDPNADGDDLEKHIWRSLQFMEQRWKYIHLVILQGALFDLVPLYIKRHQVFEFLFGPAPVSLKITTIVSM